MAGAFCSASEVEEEDVVISINGLENAAMGRVYGGNCPRW